MCVLGSGVLEGVLYGNVVRMVRVVRVVVWIATVVVCIGVVAWELLWCVYWNCCGVYRNCCDVPFALQPTPLLPPPFLSGLLQSLSRLGLASVEPQGLSNVVWALGKLDLTAVLPQQSAILDDLMHVILTKSDQLCPQDISNVVYGLANIGCARYHPSSAVLESMAETALCHLHAAAHGGRKGEVENTKGVFTPQGIGNTLWYVWGGCGMLMATHLTLYVHVFSVCLFHFHDIHHTHHHHDSPHTYHTHTHRAYAKLNHNPLQGRLVNVMMDHVLTNLDRFPSQVC